MSDAIAHELYADLLGVPYAHHGRSVATGLDCFGLVAEFHRRRGIQVLDIVGDKDALSKLARLHVGWQRLDKPEPGCAIMRQPVPDDRQHVAIFLGDGFILHTQQFAGTTVARLDAFPIEGFYRWVGSTVACADWEPTNDLLVIEYDALMQRSLRLVRWNEALTLEEIAGALHVVEADMRPGGQVVLATVPATPAEFIIFMAMTLLTAVMSSMGAQAQRPDEPGSAYFDLSGLQNTSGIGYTMPVVYGEMRVGGHILSAFQRASSTYDTALHMLVCMSIGPIHSIDGVLADANEISGSAIPKHIELDGNPLSSYAGATASLRLGGPNQAAMVGFTEVVVATSYTHTLSANVPFTHSGTSECSGFDINISFPQGLSGNSNAGNAIPASVTHTVAWYKKTQAASAATTVSITTTRTRRAPFVETLRIPVPTGGIVVPLDNAEYFVTITRTTAYPTSNVSDMSMLLGVNELSRDELAYTGRACIAVRAIAQDSVSNGVPNITSTIKGRLVHVWDGVSTTAPVLKSVAEYSDNPAWCLMDILLNEQFGMGRNGRLTLSNIHLPTFVEWAQNCDTMVDDGRGGTMKRAVFAFTMDTVVSGWDWAVKVAACHWGRLMKIGNQVRVSVDKASTPIYSFSAGNVRDVSIGYTGRSQRPNVIEVQYLNSENKFETDYATKTDETAVFTNGEPVVKETLHAIGVTRAAHAYRLAQFRRNSARLSTKLLNFTAGPESLHLLPGDVIYFSHDAVSSEAGGRILGATSTTVTLDRDIVASGGTGRINCRTNGDTFEERTLTNGTYTRGAAITVTAAWTSTPTAGAPYLAGASTSYSQTFRISTIDTEPDLSRKFACSQYDASIYSDDPGTVETFTDDMPDPRTLPALPTNVLASSEHILGADDGSEDYLRIEWTPAAGWHSADIWLKATDDAAASWERRGRHHGGNALLCCGIRPNTSYAVSVVPVGARGNALGGADSGAVVFVYTRGRTWQPDAPTAQSASVTAGILSASVSTVDGATEYEWRVGRTWSGSVVMAVTKEPKLVMPIPWWGAGDIMCRSVSSTGTRSESSATFAPLQPVANESFQQVDLSHSADGLGWPGTKTDVAVSGVVAMSGSALTGSYTTAALTPYLDGQHQSVRVFANCGLQDVAMTWDHAIFNWDDAHADQTWATAYLNGAELKENLTWEEAGQTWAGFGGQMYTWGGPVDIDAALASTVSVNTNAAGLVAFTETVEDTISTVAARITFNRPHVDYIPECREFLVNTLHYSMTEPERFTLEYFGTSATGVNGRWHGLISTASTDAKFKVPTGKILTIIGCNAVATTGTTAGTYTVNAIIRNTTDSADVIVASASTTSVSTRLHINAQGTRIAPLAILAAGKEYQIGWHNAASSPGALTSATQVVNFTAILETA